jgi:hypothetical protein
MQDIFCKNVPLLIANSAYKVTSFLDLQGILNNNNPV